LPPELRKRIYSYVLGGQNIHVSRRFNPAGTIALLSLCTHPPLDAKTLAEAQFDPAVSSTLAVGNGISCRDHIVDPGWSVTKIGFDLSLLSTCTQIYLEARLLPFAENTFTFDTVLDLMWLLSILLPEQIQCIQSVAARVDFQTGWMSEKRKRHFEEAVSRLRRLNRVTTYYDICSDFRVTMARTEGMLMKQLLPFGKLGLSSCVIAAYSSDMGVAWERPEIIEMRKIHEQCRAWSKVITDGRKDCE